MPRLLRRTSPGPDGVLNTADDVYLDAARLAFAALSRPIAQKGSILVDRGDTWIEEYLPPYSVHTLNGFLFACLNPVLPRGR